jgi:acyl-coenzyme A thioesterase PaaI-like protein
MLDGKVVSEQRDVTAAVLDAVRGFLGGPVPDGDGWVFELGDHLHSNWGAVYGGAIAAASLAVARAAAPEQSPRSLHIQLVRATPSGPTRASVRVRHAGRTVSTVEVDLHDERDKLTSVALVTMVATAAVANAHDNQAAAPQFRTSTAPFEDAGIRAPVVDVLKLGYWRDGALADDVVLVADNYRPAVDGTPAGVSTCTVPWDNLAETGPEASCLLADSLIGFSILQSELPTHVLGPNPDLTLRFTTAAATKVITGAASVLSVQRGTATTGLEVQAGDQQLAHGLATSLLLDRG